MGVEDVWFCWERRKNEVERTGNTCAKSPINSLMVPKHPLRPRDGRRAQPARAQPPCVAACEGPATELQQEHAKPTVSVTTVAPPGPYRPLAFHKAVPTTACRRPADLERCHLPERQQIPGAALFPEACSWSARGRARERGRRGRERGGATPKHTGLAWEDSLLGGRVGAVNPASPAGKSGWGNVDFSGGSIDKEEERIPGPHAVGGPRGPGTRGRNSRAARRDGGG